MATAPTTAQYIAALLALCDLDPKTKLPVRVKKTSLPDADDQYKADLKAWLSDGTTTSPAPTPSPVASGELLPAEFPRQFSLKGAEGKSFALLLEKGATYSMLVKATGISLADGGVGVGIEKLEKSYKKLENGSQVVQFGPLPTAGLWTSYVQANGGNGTIQEISFKKVG